MKNTLLFLSIITITLSCKAQSPIVDLEERDLPDNLNNYYFKDLNNLLNKFVGTWKYENGNTSLTIQLVKREQIFSGTWYEDELHGEYRYVENGVEVVNYLPRLFDPNVTVAQHTIDGNQLVYKNYPPECLECALSDKRVVLKFSDRDRTYLRNQILVQYINDNGTEKLKIILDGSAPMFVDDGDPAESRVPYGEYLLIKQ